MEFTVDSHLFFFFKKMCYTSFRGDRMLVCHLKRILNRKGISQTKLSEDTGIRPQSVTDLCNNRFIYINLMTLHKLCIYLDVTPGELLENKDDV